MGNFPSVNLAVTVSAPVTVKSYQQHALITFVPSTTDFMNGFLAAPAQKDVVFKDPNTLETLVIKLPAVGWEGKLTALGATSDEPLWHAINGHFNPKTVPDENGIAQPTVIPDVVYIGRRTSATVTIKTLTYTTNTIGSTTYYVLPAPFIFGDNPEPNVGALAIFTVDADGILTPTQLATDFQTQFNAAVDPSIAVAAPGGPGESTVTSAAAGYPIVIVAISTNPGPTVTQTDDTSVLADAYYDDLEEMKQAAEIGIPNDPLSVPMRRWYWITDLQQNDLVNAQGFDWAQDQGALFPIRDYQYHGWSGSALNFSALAANSPAQLAQQANGGDGWSRGSVWHHNEWEFIVPCEYGRCIGYEPGEVNFGTKVLYGANSDAKISPRDYGDAENLAVERTFNYYSAEGTRGMTKWGYLADGSYIDRKWTEDWIRRTGYDALIAFMQRNNILTFTDDDIIRGQGIIKGVVAACKAVDPNKVTVTFKRRAALDPNDIANRRYVDYAVVAGGRGVINMFGTPTNPILITVVENLV